MTQPQAPFRETYFPSAEMRVERRADGTVLLTPVLELEPYVPNLPAELARWASRQPGHPFLAERPAPGAPWRRLSYGELKRDTDAVAQWLLDRRIGPGRSVLILSGNSIAHATLKFGAMAARVPGCPVSVNYSLMPGDFGRLRHVVSLVKPAVVFAEKAATFRRALETLDFGDATLVTDDPAVLARPAVAWSEVLATVPGAGVGPAACATGTAPSGIRRPEKISRPASPRNTSASSPNSTASS